MLRFWMLAVLAMTGVFALALPSGVRAMDMVGEANWLVVETVEVLGHSPHDAVRLYEEGSIDAVGFRPQGGDAYCFSIKIMMADGRRSYIENRRLRRDEVNEFEMTGADRRVDRVEFNCHPSMGVSGLMLDIVVR